ncbi:MAG TPA: C69 family dipeptidase [Gemmataceae bacterium]|nr:C69 family dipeptidase [Gemmataceae bacterium]
MLASQEDLFGCDTLVATATGTADRSVIFAKNSDRLPDECQHLRVYPSRDWQKGATLRCQYVSLPQVRHTYRVLGSQPFWLWGFEHGVNERGVAIGNEAIWTTAPRQRVGLLGMDLIRLGLERGGTAREALDVMTALLEKHGQGGSPRHNDPKAACYDSSFILADPGEAWVLETSGRSWAARRIQGVYSISNRPCLGSDFDLASAALRGRKELDFARDLGDYTKYPQTSGQSRCKRSRQLLQDRAGHIGVADMMTMLSDHGGASDAKKPGAFGPTLCAHPGTGQTAASMVAHLHKDGIIAWCSFVTPCIGIFLPFFVDASVPEVLAQGAATFTAASPWWRVKRLLDHAAESWGELFPRLRAHWQDWQQALLREAAKYHKESCDHKSIWVSRNVTKWLTEIAALERAFSQSR